MDEFIPIEDITVSGVYDKPFYPVWVNSFGQVSINVNGLGSSGWLLMGGTATGPIIANYVDDVDATDYGHLLARKSVVDRLYSNKLDELSNYLPLSGGILEYPVLLQSMPDKNSAATVGYLNGLANSYLRTETTDTLGVQQMSGPITLHSTLDSAYDILDAVPRSYVEHKISEALTAVGLRLTSYIELDGDTITGNLEVSPPVEDCDAATLAFVRDYLATKTIEYFSQVRK